MIEWKRVQELKDDFGEDDFNEIVAVFLEEVEGSIASLRADPTTNTKEQVHYLKGASLNLGFRDLSDLCAAIESELADDPSRALNVDRISSTFAQSKDQFDQGLT